MVHKIDIKEGDYPDSRSESVPPSINPVSLSLFQSPFQIMEIHKPGMNKFTSIHEYNHSAKQDGNS